MLWNALNAAANNCVIDFSDKFEEKQQRDFSGVWEEILDYSARTRGDWKRIIILSQSRMNGNDKNQLVNMPKVCTQELAYKAVPARFHGPLRDWWASTGMNATRDALGIADASQPNLTFKRGRDDDNPIAPALVPVPGTTQYSAERLVESFCPNWIFAFLENEPYNLVTHKARADQSIAHFLQSSTRKLRKSFSLFC